MRGHFFVAGLFLIELAVFGQRTACGADAELLAVDEQALKTAHLGTDGPALLAFLRELSPTDANRASIQRLIQLMGDDDFEVREKASVDLVGLGYKTITQLRMALSNRDPEIARRAEACLDQLDKIWMNATMVDFVLVPATVRLVGARKPVGFLEVLLDYLPHVKQDTVVDEIELALAAVALVENKSNPILVKALVDKEPRKRAVAAAALARAGAAEQKNALHKLLKDPEPEVRLRLSMALAYAKDKEAVPVLIDLLSQLPAEQVWPVEDQLRRLAGEKAPDVSLGTDAASKDKCRDAWAAWWRANGDTLEMPALETPPAQLGYTLVVIADYGILELDRKGKVRWQVTNLGSPFDAQVLPGNRLLIAEYAGRVTERNLKGEVLWQQDIPNAMQCQRLPNGNTFVVTLRKLLEVDPKGKTSILYEHQRKDGSLLVVAKRLRNGSIVFVDSSGTCTTLDAGGKEVSSFAAGRISNNCLDVLPNGHILVTKFFDGKVTEYDAGGKVVWEISFSSPFSAQRLPNGNTLVACHEPARVVELDRAGKVVWEYKAESPNHRPWFASRR